MNDRHPSGTMTTPAPASDAASADYASYGTPENQYGDFTTYDAYDATAFGAASYDPGAHATTSFATDPLFGDLPGSDYAVAGTTGAYDATQWTTGGQGAALDYDAAYAAQQQVAQHAGYDTGTYDATAWTSGYQQVPAGAQQPGAPDATGQWDAGSWVQPDQSGNPADQTQQWEWGTQAFDTGAYDATQWNADSAAQPTETYEQHGESYDERADAAYDRTPYTEYNDVADHARSPYGDPDQDLPDSAGAAAGGESFTPSGGPRTPLLDEQEEVVVTPGRAASRAGARSRRRSPAKRSALMTVAVPSACVMGVAGIAAASVSGMSEDGAQETSASAADAKPVQPATANNKLDTQLASLTAGADDFADRASRTQERIDLRAQQEAEKKRAAAEAARKERLRPKFALPVTQHGLSAYYGQAGINWMSAHSGIDFPVSYGTSVLAATDGTVRTQWNSAYGNMLIVTAKDGTETWYCHLSTYRVSTGATVKAGDPVAYSGNSGNSTGPHLHFEVRPAGGAAIDPLPWLRSHGLDPQ